jgi:hypothetical protein
MLYLRPAFCCDLFGWILFSLTQTNKYIYIYIYTPSYLVPHHRSEGWTLSQPVSFQSSLNSLDFAVVSRHVY